LFSKILLSNFEVRFPCPLIFEKFIFIGTESDYREHIISYCLCTVQVFGKNSPLSQWLRHILSLCSTRSLTSSADEYSLDNSACHVP
jgi:hypothetical protein